MFLTILKKTTAKENLVIDKKKQIVGDVNRKYLATNDVIEKEI